MGALNNANKILLMIASQFMVSLKPMQAVQSSFIQYTKLKLWTVTVKNKNNDYWRSGVNWILPQHILFYIMYTKPMTSRRERVEFIDANRTMK